MLYVTMTAVLRPEIIRRTLSSFREHLFKDNDVQLIANVDMVGEKYEFYQMRDLIESFFPYSLIQTQDTPNFATAQHRLWNLALYFSNPGDFIFNLEDDWEIHYDVDLGEMMYTMEKIPDLAILRLSMFKSDLYSMKNWNKFLNYNKEDGFFECSKDDRVRIGFCGHPSLIRRDWLESIIPLISSTRNPEKQIQLSHRLSPMAKELLRWRYGVWAAPMSQPAISDIGRKWMSGIGLKKSGDRAWFTTYEENSNA